MAHTLKSEDRDLFQWSMEFSKKKIDMRHPRLRVQNFMQEDPDRWIINATLNHLRSQSMQKYMEAEEEGSVDLFSLEDSEEDEYHERIHSEMETSQFSLPTQDVTISTSSFRSRNAKRNNTDADNRSLSIEFLLPSVVAGDDREFYDDISRSREDDSVIARERLIQKEIDRRVKGYLELDNPEQKYYSSTVKVFSDSSLSDSEDSENKTVELKKIEELPVHTQTETLQEILLTPMPGPGFRMAQVAHPDDVFGPGRRLPSVYFLKPRVRIFSAFPHCQQFWCRQGNPIPVPPPSRRNTFLDTHLLSANHPKAKLFPFRVRTYKANMTTFLADELIFIVEGRNVFVTGEKRKENKVIRTVTEEICLPIDLDLNYVRVAQTNEGEVIFEELWEYDSKTKTKAN